MEIEKIVPLALNEIVLDEELMEFFNRHGFLRIDMQLHAIYASRFSENITLDLKTYKTLKNLKRSIINLN